MFYGAALFGSCPPKQRLVLAIRTLGQDPKLPAPRSNYLAAITIVRPQANGQGQLVRTAFRSAAAPLRP